MGQIKFNTASMQGLTPAIDPVEGNAIFAIEGENYVFDSKGPKSAFGNRALTPQPMANPAFTQGIRLKLPDGDRCFQMDSDGIWEWNEAAGSYDTIYLTGSIVDTPGAWSAAYLAGLFYFCHRAVGILVFNPDTNICVPHAKIGVGAPTGAISVAENNGRLGVLDEDFMYWSAASNGLDFTPKLGGAGFQLLSDRVSGFPLAITSYPGGFLSWTTGGVLRSEFTGDPAVFRHRSLNTKIRPVNSFCTCKVEGDVTVILDERGLFKSGGDIPTPYAPLFNEFLQDYIRENRMKVNDNLQLEYDELQGFLYVFASTTYGGTMYQRTFVYYQALDKWGEFSELHNGIFPILIGPGSREGDYFGFVDRNGIVRYWLPTESRECYPVSSGNQTNNLYESVVQKPVQYDLHLTGRIMPACGRVRGFDATGIARRSAYYPRNVVVPAVSSVTGLGSRLQFGLWRTNNQGSSDLMGEVIGVMIRSWEKNISANEAETIEDYMDEADTLYDEDWNALSGAEDWNQDTSFASQGSIGFDLSVIGTLDGINSFVTATPELVETQRGARYYSCSVPGVWHKLEVKAADVGDSFHIKSGEITAVDGGRLL